MKGDWMKELSKKSDYWLPKSVYLGLRQYVWSIPYYEKLRAELIKDPAVRGACTEHWDIIQKQAKAGDPTFMKAAELYSYNDMISKYKRAWDYMKKLQVRDSDLKLIRTGIEDNCSYDVLMAKERFRYSGLTRKEYYALCRYFFWALHKCIIGLA